MRWVTFPGSRWTHAVFKGETETVCELSIAGASIARLGVDNRCRGCDYGWREKSLGARPKAPRQKENLGEYEPRNVVEWEKERET